MTEGQEIIRLRKRKESTTQLVIDGEITTLELLYQVVLARGLEGDEIPFLKEWAGRVEKMPLHEVSRAASETGVHELILIGCLGLGVEKVTLSDFLKPMEKHPKYEVITRAFLNYMQHFL